MKRKTATLLAILFLPLTVWGSSAHAAMAFPDISENYRYYGAVEWLKGRNVIHGYPDGTFRPRTYVNRAEAAKMIGIAFQNNLPRNRARCFPDVHRAQWFYQYICESGLIDGYADGLARPDRDVTVAEALKMIGVAKEGIYPTATNPWFTALMARAVQKEDVTVNVPGTKKLERGELATLIARALVEHLLAEGGPGVVFHTVTVPTQYTPPTQGSQPNHLPSIAPPPTPPPTPSPEPSPPPTPPPSPAPEPQPSPQPNPAPGPAPAPTPAPAPDPSPTPPPAGPPQNPTPADNFILPPQNYKIAFIGDTGYDDELCQRDNGRYEESFCDLLQLIKDENADLVLHQGDLSYGGLNTNRNWMASIDAVLGPQFPYFFTLGNHDDGNLWMDPQNGYRKILQEQFAEAGITPNGGMEWVGVRSSFAKDGVFVVHIAPGEDDTFEDIDPAHGDEYERTLDQFTDTELSENAEYLWQICGWHKTMRESQIGGKGDDAGSWNIFEKCREQGAIIAHAHEHSYERSQVFSNMEQRTLADTESPYVIQPGQTFMFISGAGGRSLRGQERCEPSGGAPYPVAQTTCNGEWAAIYTEETVYSQNGQQYVVGDRRDSEDDKRYEAGALFLELYVDGDPRKARGYFKNALGHTIDTFEIYNRKGSPVVANDPGPAGNPPPPDPTPYTPPQGNFVYAQNTDLMLNGSEYKFMGANAYGAANSAIYSCGPYGYGDNGMNQEGLLRSMFRHFQENGMSVLRFWAFQAFTENGTDYTALDRLFRIANEYNIKVIPTLENQWDHCPDNIHKGANWYREGYQSPYGDYLLSFPDYVERTVERYKNEPAILMWQLMNEAESSDASALLNFTRDMATRIKRIDSNHLVSLGTMATGQPGTANEHLVNLHSLNDPELGKLIDVLEIHDYNHDEEAWPSGGHNDVARAASVAINLNMPFFIGETGIRVDGNTTHAERATLFNNKFRAFFEHGGAGYLLWRWSNDEYDEGCSTGNCVTVDDPVLDIIQTYPR